MSLEPEQPRNRDSENLTPENSHLPARIPAPSLTEEMTRSLQAYGEPVSGRADIYTDRERAEVLLNEWQKAILLTLSEANCAFFGFGEAKIALRNVDGRLHAVTAVSLRSSEDNGFLLPYRSSDGRFKTTTVERYPAFILRAFDLTRAPEPEKISAQNISRRFELAFSEPALIATFRRPAGFGSLNHSVMLETFVEMAVLQFGKKINGAVAEARQKASKDPFVAIPEAVSHSDTGVHVSYLAHYEGIGTARIKVRSGESRRPCFSGYFTELAA
ncbi:MAG: hypothetical protein D6719_07150 [Candidatus Dadabacteria bacterium]|nr:MAG: hypothetical protein D6719_07150 [Candidatus Dadabacteria bacterium]